MKLRIVEQEQLEPAQAGNQLLDDDVVGLTDGAVSSSQGTADQLVVPLPDHTTWGDPQSNARLLTAYRPNVDFDLGRRQPQVFGKVERRFSRDVSIEFRPEASTGPIVSEIEVPILRLHCPKKAGCTGTETWTTSDDAEANLEVTFAGIGGGLDLSTKLVATESWTAKDGVCLEQVVTAQVRLQLGSLFVDDTSFATVFMVEVSPFDESDIEQRPIPDDDDTCRHEMPTNPSMTSFAGRIRQKAGERTVGWKAASSLKGTAKIDLTFFDEKFGTTFAFKRATTAEVAREYKLVQGAVYQPYVYSTSLTPEQSSEIFWWTDNI